MSMSRHRFFSWGGPLISQTVEYALRAIVVIAQSQGVPSTAQKISATTRVPAPYLSKVMQGLVRSGVVRSQRGIHGGFVLTKEPSQLSIYEIVDAVEPLRRIHSCPLGIPSHSGTLCPLHRRLDDALATVEKSFRETTIAELLADPSRLSPLCQEGNVVGLKMLPPKEPQPNRKKNEAGHMKKSKATAKKKTSR